MSKPIIISLIAFAGVVVVLLISVLVGLMWLNAKEYKPADIESIEVFRSSALLPVRGQPIELYIWNIGYASLDASQDFILDGGKNVRPPTARNVEENIWAIQAFFSAAAADIILLQEVDTNSKRSYGVDQAQYFSETWKGSSAFAYNIKSRFIPFPFPRFIGRTESGLLTLSSFGGTAERVSLPAHFPWPDRLVQFKRCLLINRSPIQNSEAELVLINLHMDAYDEGGQGRIAQAKVLVDLMLKEYEKGNYVVAGGDFNMVFPQYLEQFPIQENPYFTPGIFDDSLLDEDWILAADPSVPTSRLLNKPYDKEAEGNHYLLIDGFILSPNVELISVQTQDLEFKNSDHNPVKLTFSLK